MKIMRKLTGYIEIAINEEELKKALKLWFEELNSIHHDVIISEIKHSRSDSPYALRFLVSQKAKAPKK